MTPKYEKMLDELEQAYPGASDELDALRSAVEGEQPEGEDSGEEEPAMEPFGDDNEEAEGEPSMSPFPPKKKPAPQF